VTLVVGQILQSRYRILRQLGQGGMGAVFLTEDLRLAARMCAVKENIPDPNASLQALAQIRRQFRAEASVLANLDHPNLPKVSDYFSDGGNEYIVMEYVEGEDLASVLAREGRPLPEKPVLIWADQVLDALKYLHGQWPNPILHRDIKPANIILTSQGRIKLVDFGLVKLLDPDNPQTATVMKGMGTPEYAPLEQYASGAGHTDARSDIYSFGATLYHLLTNVRPPDVHQRLLDPTKLVPPRQISPALSAATQTAVLKAIEVYPNGRFQAAHEFRQALAASRAALQPQPLPPVQQTSPATVRGAAAPATHNCPRCGRANGVDEIYCQTCASSLVSTQPCPHCRASLPANTVYCPACGRAVTTTNTACPRCGRTNAPGEIYCQGCAKPLTASRACRYCSNAVPQNVRHCPKCGHRM
jgi:eukaryotic-like serine/threonine-protein kinase